MMKRLYPAGLLTMGARIRRTVALVATITLLGQNFASATCSNGQSLPAGGFVVGRDAVVANASNWSPGVFTGTAGSIFVPDASVNERNDVSQPLTGGGHNWVFDQGSTLCKVTDTGVDPGTGRSASWDIPPNEPTDCVILPVIKNGQIVNLGDIPFQGQAITPTCNPAILATASNTYFNQLGCLVSALKNAGTVVATTPQSATTFMFVAGIKGGLFSVSLDNANPVFVGGQAGKTVGPQNYYSDIPEGTKLTNAAVSPDGMFAIATSKRRDTRVWSCLNPLGDPGDPSLPITPATITNFANTQAGASVKCMVVGSNGLQVDLTTVFGPDNQPYFGGQRVVTTFDTQPGGSTPTAWPQCIFNGVTGLPGAFPTGGFAALMADLKFVFDSHLATHCGMAQSNFGFTSALITQPAALWPHVAPNGDMYMYTGPTGGTIVQFKLTKQPFSGTTQYTFRTYITGLSILTGIGTADDLSYSDPGSNGQGSLMIYTDPTALGLSGDEIVTRLPLCEDM